MTVKKIIGTKKLFQGTVLKKYAMQKKYFQHSTIINPGYKKGRGCCYVRKNKKIAILALTPTLN